MPPLSPSLPAVPPGLVVLVNGSFAFGTLVACSVWMIPHLQVYESQTQQETRVMFVARLGLFVTAGPRGRLAFSATQHLQWREIPLKREISEKVEVPLVPSVTGGPHILPAPSGAWPHAAVSASRLVIQVI